MSILRNISEGDTLEVTVKVKVDSVEEYRGECICARVEDDGVLVLGGDYLETLVDHADEVYVLPTDKKKIK